MSEELRPDTTLQESRRKNRWRKTKPWEWVLLVIVLWCLGAALWPVRPHPYESAPQSATRSNLMQVSLGIQMYLVDWDDRLPFIEPFEFGDDPIGPYLKNGSVHENPFRKRKGENLKPDSTQHEFRFAYAPMALDNGIWKRQIIDILKAEDIVSTQLAWTIASEDGSRFGIVFGDGHSRIRDLENFDVRFSPGFLGFDGLLLGRINYIDKEAEWPPPTWSLPSSDVENYVKQVKR